MNERHPLDVISLIFGVLFLGLGIPVLLLDTPLTINAQWALPATVIVVGLLILGSALMPRRVSATETAERPGQDF
ncbi:MAG: hypothetical protein ACXW15_04770 [Acidimicrobiia bacterium]|jgi:hypothetical protein